MSSSVTVLFIYITVLSSLCWCSGATLLGGQTKIKDLDDPFVKKAASFALHTLNKVTPGGHHRVLVRVVAGTSQVVAGVRYRLLLEVGTTTLCNKSGKHLNGIVSNKECPVDQNTVKKWFADIWVKPTDPPKYILNDLHIYTN